MKELIYYIQIIISVLLSLSIYYKFENILLVMINIDSIHNLFVYILKNIYIYGRQCPKFIFKLGDNIKTFNQNIHLYEYNKDSHIRYTYYVLLYVTNININYLLYFKYEEFVNIITICMTIPYISTNYVYPYSYDIYKKIDGICYDAICKIISTLLNFIAKSLFKMEPKIDYEEIKPYLKTSKKIGYIKKFIGSFLFSLILIYVEKLGYVYSTKLIKNTYQKQMIRKNKQKNIEQIFILRQWDQLTNPIILNDFYYVYNKLNDVDYPIEIQVHEVITFIIKKILELYYLIYLSEFINLPISMPFILFLFYKFNPYVFGVTTLISIYSNTYGLFVFEIIYYINDTTIYSIKNNILNYIEKKGFLYIDFSVMYIFISIFGSYIISYDISKLDSSKLSLIIIFIITNCFYEMIHKTLYSKCFPCSNISYIKHKIICISILLFGYISNYNIFHIIFIPFILNIYFYFLWENARYEKPKEIINYVNQYF